MSARQRALPGAGQVEFPLGAARFPGRSFQPDHRHVISNATGRAGQTRSCPRLRPPRPGHARIHRLDRRSPLSVRRRALSPTGLAARSDSRRSPRRILLRRSARLSLPTHHLHGTAKPSPVSLTSRRENQLDGRKSRKDRALPLRSHRTAGAGDATPRRTHAPRSATRRPPLRHSSFHPPPGLSGHAAGLVAALSQKRSRRAVSQTASAQSPKSAIACQPGSRPNRKLRAHWTLRMPNPPAPVHAARSLTAARHRASRECCRRPRRCTTHSRRGAIPQWRSTR